MSLYKKLEHIQKNIRVPKTRYNAFNDFYYYNVDDIFKAAKPYFDGYVITVQDEIIFNQDKSYIKATATITNGEESITCCAYAQEPKSKPKMDASQCTGSTSTYARKYALNGLLLIDDSVDTDSLDNSKDILENLSKRMTYHEMKISSSTSMDELKENFIGMFKEIAPYKDKFTVAKEFLIEIEKIKDEVKKKIGGEEDAK